MATRAFLTGCDSNTEWMLEWFLKNYHKHNDTPIQFCNFGVTPECMEWIKTFGGFDVIFDVPKQKSGGWFYKPTAMLKAPAQESIWLDTDIHVLGDISGAFKYLEEGKLAMVEDKPWSARRGETWHNSGVVGIKGKPDILVNWAHECRGNPKQGDQEVLHEMVRKDPLTRMRYINDLPNRFNWLRVQLLDGQDSPDKLCMHWTGAKGKEEIRKLIYNA